jgi:hypothetical protein
MAARLIRSPRSCCRRLFPLACRFPTATARPPASPFATIGGARKAASEEQGGCMPDEVEVPRRLDFLCIGAKKAGTTWLYDQLRQHPRVWLPPVKELNVFNDTGLYARDVGRLDRRRDEIAAMRRDGRFGPRDDRFLDAYLGPGAGALDWYLDLFAESDGRCAGDIDPNVYALYRRMLSRLAQANPELKLICLLRNPTERSWSHACMLARLRQVTTMSMQQLLAELEGPGIADFSRYRQAIADLRQTFPPARLLFLAFDDIVHDPAGLLRRVWDFLAIGDAAMPASLAVRSNVGHTVPMPPQARALLDALHGADLASALETLGVAAERLRL